MKQKRSTVTTSPSRLLSAADLGRTYGGGGFDLTGYSVGTIAFPARPAFELPRGGNLVIVIPT